MSNINNIVRVKRIKESELQTPFVFKVIAFINVFGVVSLPLFFILGIIFKL